MHQRSTASPPRKWLTVMVVFLFLCGCLPNPARAPKPTGVANRTTPDLRESVKVLPVGQTGSDVGADAAAANQTVAAPIISHNGGSAIQGVVRVPAHIISHNGGSIISHNGGAIIGNNGGSIISHNGGSIISHNGGSIIGNNGGSFRVPQVPLANAVVRLKDAAGAPVLDSFGKAIVTQTDAQGNYAFPVAVSGRNLVVHAEVPGQTGNLVALLPKEGVAQGAAVEVDLASTLTLAYVLEQYVKGNLVTFERLTQEIEIKARVQTEEAIVKGAIALPETLDQGAIVAKVEEVRKAVPAVDQVFEEIRQLLIVAGIRNQGDGLPAREVPLGLIGGITGGADDAIYLFSHSRHTLWRLGSDGILHTLVPYGVWGYAENRPQTWFPGYHSGMAFDSGGNLLLADTYHNRIVKVSPDRSVTVIAGNDTPGFGGDGDRAKFAQINRPTGLAIDARGNVFFSDTENNRIRRISPQGNIDTFAGVGSPGVSGDGGSAKSAELNRPQGLAFDAAGRLLISDYGNGKIRRIEVDGRIETVGSVRDAVAVGSNIDGSIWALSHSAELSVLIGTSIRRIPLDSSYHRTLFVHNSQVLLDSGGGQIWRVNEDDSFSKIAGAEQSVQDTNTRFLFATSLAIDKSGAVFVADMRARRILKVQSSGTLETLAGNGQEGYLLETDNAASSAIGTPYDLACGQDNELLFSTIGDYPSIRRLSMDGRVTVIAGNGVPNQAPPTSGPALGVPLQNPHSLITLGSKVVFTQSDLGRILQIDGSTVKDYLPPGTFTYPAAFAQVGSKELIFLERRANKISRAIDGVVSQLIDGNSVASTMHLVDVQAMAVDQDGNLYIAGPSRIVKRKVNGEITIVAGAGGPILNGLSGDDGLFQLTDIAFSPKGDLYVLEPASLKRIPKTMLDTLVN